MAALATRAVLCPAVWERARFGGRIMFFCLSGIQFQKPLFYGKGIGVALLVPVAVNVVSVADNVGPMHPLVAINVVPNGALIAVPDD
jgi:hypothetical protein